MFSLWLNSYDFDEGTNIKMIKLKEDGFQLFTNHVFCAKGNQVRRNSELYKEVSIPHDYAIEQAYGSDFPKGKETGFMDCFHDITYRKEFIVERIESQEYYLYFDGVFRNSSTYVNDNLVIYQPLGYFPFYQNITEYLMDGNNTLEVYVDNREVVTDRWYTGMGIFRDFWLVVKNKTHFSLNKDVIETNFLEDGTVNISTQYQLQGMEENVEVQVEIVQEDSDIIVGRVKGIVGNDKNSISLNIDLDTYTRWSLEQPVRYIAKAYIIKDGEVLDTCSTYFGIREISYDVNHGFRLNGNGLKLKGVNLHHDSGCLGAAYIHDAWRRKLERLKEIGVNAVRCSHNPQAEDFYDLCDELGLLVYAEAFDKWHWKGSYTAQYFDAYWKASVQGMLDRDRNHPSIFIWSVGNEVEAQGSAEMIKTLNMLVDYVKSYEPTRPVSVALMPHCNPISFGLEGDVNLLEAGIPTLCEVTSKICENVDIISANYQEQWYTDYHKKMPEKCILGTEIYHYYTAQEGSCYFNNMVDRHPYTYVLERDYVIGGFYWAGVDYLGESFRYPARGWSASLFDIAGFPRPQVK